MNHTTNILLQWLMFAFNTSDITANLILTAVLGVYFVKIRSFSLRWYVCFCLSCMAQTAHALSLLLGLAPL